MMSFLGYIARILVALLPWAGTLYLLYRLEYAGIWMVDMPFRALLSALFIAAGMLASFWLYGRLTASRA